MKRFLITFAGVMNLLFADQFTKNLAILKLKGCGSMPIVEGFFDLCYVENFGCAWGMFQGHVWPLAVFGIFSLAVLIWKRSQIFGDSYVIPIMMYAGIAGNVIDRLAYGYVVDFLDFHWHQSHFPCFNLADAFITVSVGLMMISSYVVGNKSGKNS